MPEKKYIGIKKLKIYDFLCLSKLTMIQFINIDNDSMLKKVFHLTMVSCPPTSSVLSTSRCVSKYGTPSSDYSRLFQIPDYSNICINIFGENNLHAEFTLFEISLYCIMFCYAIVYVFVLKIEILNPF